MQYDKFNELKENLAREENALLMQELTDVIQDYFQEFLTELKQAAIENISNEKLKFGEIVTALIEEDAVVPNTILKPMVSPEILYSSDKKQDILRLQKDKRCMKVFLNCSYEEFLQYTDPSREYKAVITFSGGLKKEVVYKLIYDNSLIKREQLLYKCAKLNKIEHPICFAPYSRRLAKIVLNLDNFHEELDEVEDIYFCVEDNGKKLDDIVVKKANVYWNVDFKSIGLDYLEPKRKVVGDYNYYEYKFSTTNNQQFLVYKAYNGEIRDIAYKKNKQVIVDLLEEASLVDDFQFVNINALPFNMTIRDCYTNQHLSLNSENIIHIDRIKSLGDAEFVARSFKAQLGIQLDKVNLRLDDSYTLTPEYKSQFSIRTDGEIHQSKKILYLLFNNTKKSLFVCDYINFIISYLNENYPEFEWCGAYK